MKQRAIHCSFCVADTDEVGSEGGNKDGRDVGVGVGDSSRISFSDDISTKREIFPSLVEITLKMGNSRSSSSV